MASATRIIELLLNEMGKEVEERGLIKKIRHSVLDIYNLKRIVDI